jgi:diguanylate cyclase (GGDEF)-like protein/PAS domain S-box-containing protein
MNTENASVLVVEDEAIVALDLTMQLESMGYKVVGTAESGEEAIRLARLHRPKLVLMDIMLKGEMDGVEAAEQIGRGLHVPVVFLTSYIDSQTVQRAARATPYGYMTKPFQTKELRATIEVALYKARMETQLRESERWFASALRCVGDGVVVIEPDGHIRFLNAVAEQLTGWTQEDAVGVHVDTVIDVQRPADQSESQALRALRGESVVGIEHALVLKRRGGQSLRVDESAAPVFDEQGNKLGVVVVLRDATERLRQEALMRQSEEHFRSMFENAPLGMALISLEGSFIRVNAALCQFLGRSEEALMQLPHEEITFSADVEAEKARQMALLSGGELVAQFEKRYKHADQRPLWSLVSISLLRDHGEPVCYLYQVHDLMERKEMEQRMARLAYSDPLTNLSNRAHLLSELERLLAFSRRHKQQLAVIYMDLDRFKQINDTMGHEAGDRLLQEVAKRLSANLREVDCVARMGGDEFVMALTGVHTTEDVIHVVEKLRRAVAQPLTLGDKEIIVTPSLGISLYPHDGADADELLRHADMALYAAKAEGRNRYSFFRPQWAEQAEKRLAVQHELRLALINETLSLVYQPVFRLADRAVVRFEALLRWYGPEGEMAPAQFVPVAEASGLIHEIGAWVLDQACAFTARCPGGLPVDVNCSAVQLSSPGFLDIVKGALAEHNLDAGRLGLDFTERIVTRGDQSQLQQLARLKALGVRLSVDDFGTGDSPLPRLTRCAFDRMKIDSVFVQGLDENEGEGVVAAMIAMAGGLGLEVVAEGVETADQAQRLQKLGCTQAQGFYFSMPLTAEDALALVVPDKQA